MKTQKLSVVALFFVIVLLSSCKKQELASDYYQRGVSLFNEKEYSKALLSLESCLLIDEDFAIAYLQRAVIFRRLELYGKALQNINKFLTYDTLLAVGYTERGLQRVKLNDYYAALEDCKRAVEADKGYYKAYYCSGRALIGAQEYPDALSHLSTSIKLNDEYGKAYYYRGLLLAGMEDNSAACKDFTRAAELGDLRALGYLDEVCTGPEVVEKVVVKEVVKEVEKPVEKKELEEEKPVVQSPVYQAADNIYEVHSYFSNFSIQYNQEIDWGEKPASPEDLYVMVRKLDDNLYYVGFYSEGEHVYGGKYQFSDINDGFLYKRTDISQSEELRVNMDLEDCSSGKIAADRTILELVNYTRSRGVKLIF